MQPVFQAFLFAGILTVLAARSPAQSSEFDRARQLLTSGRAAEAAAIYRSLSQEDPESPDLLLNLSIAEYKAERFRQAAESAAAALKLSPNLIAASLFLGASRLELGEFSEAVTALERVAAANPNDRNGRLMLGQALAGAGRPDAAVDHLRAASKMLPESPRVWYELGRAYEALGRKTPAGEAWDRLMALPPSLESHMHRAEIHADALRWREAAKEWSEALKLAPGKLNVRVGLAWSLFRSREYDASMATLKPVLTADSSGEVEFLYGASLLNLQQPSEAIPHLRAALAQNARMLPARAALGQALLQTGKPDDAIPLLEESISVDEDGSIHFQLFRAYQLTNRAAEAQKALAAYRRFRSSASASR
jgi:predicted Zn-dependent protease